MHLDKEDFNVHMFIKLGISVSFFLILPVIPALISLIIVAVAYRHVVAKMYGLHVMPIMDLNCFYSNDNAIPNIIYA